MSALWLDTCPEFFYRVGNMPRLIVNPGTENAWEIPLQPGAISLGRGPENTFSIEHPSVSSAHCQLTVTDSSVIIKDLGSVNGTFVNDAMVDEAPLSNGQTFRLGDVVLQFESDQIPLARPMRDVVVQPQSAIAAFCKFHPHAAAQFLCPKCRMTFCDLCVSHRQGRYFCRACSVECGPLAQQTRTPEALKKSYYAQILEAFNYPFKGNGFILLIGGAIFFLVLEFLERVAGMLGPYGFVPAGILAIFGAGYVFSYAKSIITSTANGEETPPDWPDFTDWQEDIVQPFGQMVGLLAFNFGPAAVLHWWQPGSETFAHAVTLAATALGAFLAPMGMLGLAMFDSIAALNPYLLLKSIFRIPLSYLAAAAGFELLTAVYFKAGGIIGLLIPIQMLSGTISVFLNLFLTLAGMRILGLLYRAKADDLGWFGKDDSA